MENLLQKLQQLQHLSPDQIVAELSSQIFDRKTFRPWEVPAGLEGRHVLIYYNYCPDPDDDSDAWWRGPGHGSSSFREEGVAWPIEAAFARFVPSRYTDEDYVIQLHLLEPGHEQIPYQHA